MFGIMAILALGTGVVGALLREFFIGGFTSEDQERAGIFGRQRVGFAETGKAFCGGSFGRQE
ncbi:hypothetical protein K9B32_24565 [Rhizobium sp. 3T7]|uniref:hypothetical protein n=1 Tax=Rhizobium sp. 3T7 TaxID=2874922 RepID=UPI001CC966B0|nr:hypothetical protein [Rhizobium sp. 3T7]MBZ9793243.1 hypothetical protein [Rhizobium sp. 3T7]